MNRSFLPFLFAVGGLLCSSLPAQSDPTPTPTPSPEKNAKLQTLMGDFILGTVEVRDDYTLRVTSESGILNIPIAALNEPGFQKYASQKDRSQDGRLWSERKDALETAKTDTSQNPGTSTETPQSLEIRLAEIAAFQPFIDAYEKSVKDQKAANAAQKADTNRLSDKDASSNLFSNPAQALKALNSTVSSIPNAIPSLPVSPSSVPGVPSSIPTSIPDVPATP